MKKWIIPLSVLCVIFIFFTLSDESRIVFAQGEQINEQIEFVYRDKIFLYNLNENIKESSIFEIDYEINKYKRFNSKEDRKNLLNYMIESGFSCNIAVNYLFPNIDKKISEIEKNIEKKAQNAKMTIKRNTEQVFFIKKEQVGKRLNKVKLYHNIVEAYLNDNELIFNLPIDYIEPQIKSSDFEKYTHLRADFSTDISRSSNDRKHNIKNALESINMVELAPFAVFSFNKTVGRRTSENGYRTAKIIVNNEFVDGVGGGVCQVSTTLYNSALLAGLEILEANKHSKQISYVKYGFDAMVNYGSSDLRFKNNTNEKIIIVTNFSSTRARIRIYGEALKETSYKLVNEIVSITEPIVEVRQDLAEEYQDKVIYEDEYFYLKNAYRGMEIKSYREIYRSGKLEKRELLRFDKYKVQNGVKIYGTKKRAEFDCTLNDTSVGVTSLFG